MRSASVHQPPNKIVARQSALCVCVYMRTAFVLATTPYPTQRGLSRNCRLAPPPAPSPRRARARPKPLKPATPACFALVVGEGGHCGNLLGWCVGEGGHQASSLGWWLEGGLCGTWGGCVQNDLGISWGLNGISTLFLI